MASPLTEGAQVTITLDDTTSADINAEIIRARRRQGIANGLVYTMIVLTDAEDFDHVLAQSVDAGREHPSRIIIVATGTGDRARLDATVRMGEDVPGEVITMVFHGELTQHIASTLFPLLPDSPVVVWWPGDAPPAPSKDPIGRLGALRITDAMSASAPLTALRERADNHAVGDTDFAWTRLTRWRALLVNALDQYPARVCSAHVSAPTDNAPATLLAAWLENRLSIPVTVHSSDGPGITNVTLCTDAGDIVVSRADGALAQFTAPELPCRTVALRRRGISELLIEELRRMDTDEIFEETMTTLAERYARASKGS